MSLCVIGILSIGNLSLSQPDFWQATNGPYGGTGRELYVTNTDKIFAGSFNGGLFQSSDFGLTWTLTGLGGKTPYAIGVNQSGHIYAGTSHGTYRSTDNGQTWETVFIFTLNTLVINSSQYIIGGSQGFGPGQGSIYRSTNNGLSWETLGPENTAIFNLVIDLNGNIYAGTTDGVFKSTNEGANWNSIGLAGQSIFSVAADASGNVFAGSGTGVNKTTNGGINWTFSGLGNQVNDIKIVNSQRMFAGTFFNGAYISTNGGNNWSQINTGLSVLHIWSLGFISTGEVFAGTDEGAIYKLPGDLSSWSLVDTGYTNTLINTLCMSPNGDIYAGAGELIGNIYKSTNDGNDWSRLNTGSGFPVSSIISSNSGILFAGTRGGGIIRSTNSGNNWASSNSGLTNFNVNVVFVSDAQNVFAGTEGGIYRSTNNGVNWTTVNTGITNFSVQCLSKFSNTIYAGTYGNGIFASTNEGDLWSNISSKLSSEPLNAIGTNALGYIFVASEQTGMWRSTNNGANWETLGWPGSRVIEFASSGSNMFAGSNYSGALRSTDNGASWSEINGGLQNDIVTSLLIHSSGYIYAGTYGNGVYRSAERVVGIENISSNIPDGFKLFDNYPNPFNPSTNLKFTIPVESYVELNIFDITGKKVVTLLNKKLATGTYEYRWDASGFTSGTYFCRISADEFTDVKKMTLIK